MLPSNSKDHHNSIKEITSYFLKHPDYFLNGISSFYKFDTTSLLKYANILDWSALSSNTKINWDENLMETHKERIDWNMFASNPSAFKDQALLDKYDDYLDWEGDFKYHWGAVVWNSGLPWGIPFIEKYKSKLSFETLSISECIPWDKNIIKRYKHRWNFDLLAMNPSVPWDIDLFHEYLDESIFNIENVACNPGMLSDCDLIMKYATKVCWHTVSANSKLPWVEYDLLELWEGCYDWSGIARNELLAQHYNDFFTRFMNQWMEDPLTNFEGLSANPKLKWTPQLIQNYIDLWDWYEISQNEGIPWTKELLRTYKDKLFWGDVSSAWDFNDDPDIDRNKIKRILHPGIASNASIPWSIDLLKTFEDYLPTKALQENKAVWDKAFNPYINQELIELILRII